ncbi:MAG: hypothetical protein Q8Q56_01100 [Alphaproteobacteria bacterium]|nr:hypothetical protein [Alphaproteobacteria bacterium]
MLLFEIFATEPLFFIAQKYSYSGDLAISDYALNNILIKMNELYIREKAGEFYVDTFIEKHPLSNDTYINNSLEKLKQLLEISLAKHDDEFAIQVLRSFYRLIDCYGNIAYRNDSLNSKPHAYMALYYLCQGVSLASTQKRIEVVLNGVRLIGAATRTLLEKSNLNNIEKGLGAIEEITINCLATKESWPVVQAGVDQLAQLSKALIKSKHHNIQDSAESIKAALSVLAIEIMQLPEKNIHAELLAAYFSLSDPNSLSSFLNSLLTNVLTEKDQDKIKNTINNIYLWLLPDENYEHEMALIRMAIETRSSFTVSLLFCIVGVFKVIIDISNIELNAPIIRHQQLQLKEKAIQLLCIFNQLNVTKDTAYFLEQCHLTMHLVDMALYGLQKGIVSIDDTVDVLIPWGVRSLTRGTLVKVLFSLIAINLKYGDEETLERMKREFLKLLVRNKNKWEIEDLRKVIDIMKDSTFNCFSHIFTSHDPFFTKILDVRGIIKANIDRAIAFSKDLAKDISDILEKKDL